MSVQEPVLWDKLFDDVYKDSLDRVKENSPEYTALLPSDPGIAVMDAVLFQTVLLGEKLNVLPYGALVSWVNYLGIDAKGPVSAKGKVNITFTEEIPEDVLIPSGSRFLTEEGLSFRTVDEITADEGSTDIEVEVECETKGSIGNVSAHHVRTVYHTIPYVEEVTNPEAMTGGLDTELDKDVLERGRQQIKHLWRAVTNKDYEEIARSLAGIYKAKAIDIPGQVSVYALSENGEPINETQVTELYEYLDSHRLQGVELHVYPAELVNVNVVADVKIQPGYTQANIQTLATEKLGKLLDPKVWIWGKKITLSEIFATLEAVQGVDFVNEISIPDQNIHIEEYELAKLESVTINAI